jgi:hypothetical protein
MAVLAESGSNPDVDLLYDINGLAKDAPHWFDRVMEYVGEYGILLGMVLLVLWCWWSGRRRGGLGRRLLGGRTAVGAARRRAGRAGERAHKGVRRAAPAVPDP